MKLMFVSDSPLFESGMARVIKNTINVLKANSNAVLACVGWHQQNKSDYNGVPVFPCVKQSQDKEQTQENDCVFKAMQDFGPDVVFTLGDIWDFRYMNMLVESNPKMKRVGYYNIDAAPFNHEWANNFIAPHAIGITSKFGQEQLKKYDPTIKSSVVYHGVDTQIFNTMKIGRKILYDSKNKPIMDITNKFVVFSDAINSHRKNYAAMLQGFAKFAADKKDVFFLIATNPDAGTNIYYYIDALGLHDKIKIYKTDLANHAVLSDSTLAYMYNISDVYLSAARAEGFGLSVLQAFATNTLVVAPHYASYPELLEGRGLTYKVAALDRDMSTHRDLATVDIDDMTNKLNLAYENFGATGTDIERMKVDAYKFAMEHTWHKSTDGLVALINEASKNNKRSFYPGVPIFNPVLRKFCVTALAPDKTNVGMVVMGGLGDNIQTIPVVKGIYRRHPNCKLTIICEGFPEVFHTVAPQSSVIVSTRESFASILKTAHSAYDYFYDIRYVSRCYERANGYAYEPRGAEEIYYEQWPWANNVIHTLGKHVVDIRRTTAGLGGFSSIKDMQIETSECSLPANKYIVINNGAGGVGALKVLPLEVLEKVADYYIRKGYMVVQCGTLNDPQIKNAADLRGKLDIRKTGYVCKNAEIVLCPEGGIYHLTQAVGGRSAVWFSVTPPVVFAYNDTTIINHPTKCEPCWWKGREYFHNKCLRGYQHCCNLPTLEQITEVVDAALSSNKS